jgi:hypothetical protein
MEKPLWLRLDLTDVYLQALGRPIQLTILVARSSIQVALFPTGSEN